MLKLTPTKRFLGLDIGEKSIGLALSDTAWFIASPLDVLKRENIAKDTGRIRTLVKQHDIGALIIGWPLEMDGTKGIACEKAQHFTEKLLKKIPLPIYLQDERLSTHAAKRALKDINLTRKKKDSIDDKIAAAYILQTALDGMKD